MIFMAGFLEKYFFVWWKMPESDIFIIPKGHLMEDFFSVVMAETGQTI